MNKYQESLDFVVKNSCPEHTICRECRINKTCNNLVKSSLDKLQELINKETPILPRMMRVKEYDGYNIGFCQCGAILDTSMIEDEINYCYKCGGKVKWEDKDE